METSIREAKYQKLMEELACWGVVTDPNGVIRVLANELSWREIMRVCNKLNRKSQSHMANAIESNSQEEKDEVQRRNNQHNE